MHSESVTTGTCDLPSDKEIQRILIGSAAIMLCMVALVVLFTEYKSNDVLNFYKFGELMKSGMLPYKDFVFEFPPFALIFFGIPSLFTSDLSVYAVLFALEVVIFTLAAEYCIIKLAVKLNRYSHIVPLLFMTMVILYFPQMIKKFDVVPMVLTTIAIFLYFNNRRSPGYAALMFSALIKMYSLLMIPIFLIADLLIKRDVKSAAKGAAVCITVIALATVPLLAMSVPISDLLSFTGFHANRNIHVESLAGVIICALGQLGLTQITIVPSCDTYDVLSPLSTAVQPYILPFCALMIALVLGIAVARAFGKNKVAEPGIPMYVIIASAAIVLTFMLANKVFSTQYMVWLYPFFVILAVNKGGTCNRFFAASAVAVVALSSLALIAGTLSPSFVHINLIRDSLLIVILASMLEMLYHGEDTVPFPVRLYNRIRRPAV